MNTNCYVKARVPVNVAELICGAVYTTLLPMIAKTSWVQYEGYADYLSVLYYDVARATRPLLIYIRTTQQPIETYDFLHNGKLIRFTNVELDNVLTLYAQEG